MKTKGKMTVQLSNLQLEQSGVRVRFRPSPPTPNELFFNELQKPEETSASETASENKTGQNSMITRQILVNNGVKTRLMRPKGKLQCQ